MQQRLSVLAAALWWGSLTALGGMVVPMLFAHLPTPAMAGSMAAQLFQAQTWVSLTCALCLLLIFMPKSGETATSQGQAAMVFIIAGMLLALLIQFGVAPRIVARQNLKLWHAVGSAMYAAQWLCALALLWRTARR